jgi:hypothetical protein
MIFATEPSQGGTFRILGIRKTGHILGLFSLANRARSSSTEKGGNVMWEITNMLLSFWSIPLVLYLLMPVLIISVLLIMDLGR